MSSDSNFARKRTARSSLVFGDEDDQPVRRPVTGPSSARGASGTAQNTNRVSAPLHIPHAHALPELVPRDMPGEAPAPYGTKPVRLLRDLVLYHPARGNALVPPTDIERAPTQRKGVCAEGRVVPAPAYGDGMNDEDAGLDEDVTLPDGASGAIMMRLDALAGISMDLLTFGARVLVPGNARSV
jgi:hypothetical protein